MREDQPPRLSKREEEVLQMMRDGSSRKKIAHDLRISPNTVRTDVQRILEKLGVHSRLEAIAAEIRTSRREAIREPEPKTRTEWIHRLPEPHLRRILMERREDVLRQRGRDPSAAGRASGRRFLNRVYDELDENDLRDAVQDLTQGMSDEEFARLVERTGTPSNS